MNNDMDSSGATVTTRLKWFEPRKGFGFVNDEQSNTDAFLHFSVLKQAGYETLRPGTTIVCTFADGPKGQQVAAIVSVDESTATNEVSSRDDNGHSSVNEDLVEAEVKFYNTSKGFGFATVASLSKDVFLPGKLIPYGQEPESGQIIRLTYREGPRGLIAVSIEVN
ncbi:MAG: cold shock domain-containing protein [Alphaproteobacteria bacterium]|nr:cold shock domain-containing protein [Alphaproteobacteria bacterium]